VSRIAQNLLAIVVGEERRRRRRKKTTKQNLLEDFKNSVPGDGEVAGDDPAPSDSSSGDEEEVAKPGEEEPEEDKELYQQGNVADGESKESTLVKGGLKNDEDYGSDTKVKKEDVENETKSNAEPENRGDPDEDGDEVRDEVARSTPANLKQPMATEGQEIIDIAESPHLPPVMPRSVIRKDGNEEVCVATLPGREYYSDDIEDAVFDDAKCEPPYVDWTVGVTEPLSASKACVKRYNNCFSAKNQQSIRGSTITAQVGTQILRARDLNTLKPEEWLNNNVIDMLADRANTESTRKVAVFDTQLTKLIPGRPKAFGALYYVYDKGVGYAGQRLLGESPTKFDCLLFPNGINRIHWTIMAVFPKQQMIVCLDSLFNGNVQDARIVFWWLYDEIRYKHPADAKTVSTFSAGPGLEVHDGQGSQNTRGWFQLRSVLGWVSSLSFIRNELKTPHCCTYGRVSPTHFRRIARRKSPGVWAVTVDEIQPCKAYSKIPSRLSRRRIPFY
jgi:hypothetical protein